MALISDYIKRQLYAQQRVRAAFDLLFPNAPFPDFVARDKRGNESLNAQNWNILADYLMERVASGNVDYTVIPSDSELSKLNRTELVKYMRGVGLYAYDEDHGTKAELVERLKEFRDAETADPETGENVEPEDGEEVIDALDGEYIEPEDGIEDVAVSEDVSKE